ncbi:MAG: hypothetical protein HYY50_01205 [Candidatus Kerfeldbacteria bacterium]|nr:hypothetical protein [Candidatus Kerfeldbacteria bacterium]
MYIPKRILLMVVLALVLVGTTAFTRVRRATTVPNVEIISLGLNATFADGKPITKPIRLALHRVGTKHLGAQYVVVTGQPDRNGFMTVTAKVPVDPKFQPLVRLALQR